MVWTVGVEDDEACGLITVTVEAWSDWRPGMIVCTGDVLLLVAAADEGDRSAASFTGGDLVEFGWFAPAFSVALRGADGTLFACGTP